MNRFIVIDVFGDPIRSYNKNSDAIIFMRNRKDCTLKEISLESILGECLF